MQSSEGLRSAAIQASPYDDDDETLLEQAAAFTPAQCEMSP